MHVLVKTNWLNVDIYHYVGWIRIFGWGISWKNSRIIPLSFSQRQGHRKYLKAGKWVFSALSKKETVLL